MCDTCGRNVSAQEELMPTMMRANEILSQAQSLRKTSQDGPSQYLQLYRKAITLYQSALHPLNSELMAHIDEAMSASIGTHCHLVIINYKSHN